MQQISLKKYAAKKISKSCLRGADIVNKEKKNESSTMYESISK